VNESVDEGALGCGCRLVLGGHVAFELLQQLGVFVPDDDAGSVEGGFEDGVRHICKGQVPWDLPRISYVPPTVARGLRAPDGRNPQMSEIRLNIFFGFLLRRRGRPVLR